MAILAALAVTASCSGDDSPPAASDGGAGAELYAHYPSGIGTSKLDNARIDRHLRVVSTGRNWNTVLKLATLSRENGS